MYDETLAQRAQQIFSQQLMPGRDQKEIRSSLSELETILVDMQDQEPQLAQRYLLKTQDLYYQTDCHRLSPQITSQTRNGLEEMTYILSDILERMDSAPLQTRHAIVSTQQLANQKSLATIGIDGQHYKHIPYMLIDGQADVLEAAAKVGLKTHMQKIYHARPIHAYKQHPWNLEIINAHKAWKHNAGDDVRIGIIDTGIAKNHSEIHHAYKGGFNFIDDNQDVTDHNGHGTHVAGTIAGMDVGVAPNAHLYALKIFNASGVATEDGFLKSADWAIDNNMELLNGSFGSKAASEVELAMIQALQNHDITLIAAAGNSGNTEYSYPASYPGVVSVAAIDKHKQHANFSQRNDALTISAPGVNIYSCIPGGYDYFNGTSMATPHVTGALAILHAHNKEIDKLERLKNTAEYIGEPIKHGAGLVQVDKLIQ